MVRRCRSPRWWSWLWSGSSAAQMARLASLGTTAAASSISVDPALASAQRAHRRHGQPGDGRPRLRARAVTTVSWSRSGAAAPRPRDLAAASRGSRVAARSTEEAVTAVAEAARVWRTEYAAADDRPRARAGQVPADERRSGRRASTPCAALTGLQRTLDGERRAARRALASSRHVDAGRGHRRSASSSLLSRARDRVRRCAGSWASRSGALTDEVRQVAGGDFDREIRGRRRPRGRRARRRRRRHARRGSCRGTRGARASSAATSSRAPTPSSSSSPTSPSHDLQEPLRKVAELHPDAPAPLRGPARRPGRHYIEFAVDGAKRMQDLINDLLAFSRVGRLTRADGPSSTAASSWTGRSRPCRPRSRRPAPASRSRRPPDGPRASATLLALVFQNLIANAAEVPRRRAARTCV